MASRPDRDRDSHREHRRHNDPRGTSRNDEYRNADREQRSSDGSSRSRDAPNERRSNESSQSYRSRTSDEYRGDREYYHREHSLDRRSREGNRDSFPENGYYRSNGSRGNGSGNSYGGENNGRNGGRNYDQWHRGGDYDNRRQQQSNFRNRFGDKESNLECSVQLPSTPLERDSGKVPIVGKSKYVTRPGYGEKFARFITLVTNSYLLRLSQVKTTIYHYDIEIQNSKDLEESSEKIPTSEDKAKLRKVVQHRLKRQRRLTTEECHKVVTQLIKNCNTPGDLFYSTERECVIVPAYDGSRNMYTICPLGVLGAEPGSKIETEVTVDVEDCKEKTASYIVIIRVPGGKEEDREFEIKLTAIDEYMAGRIKDFPYSAIMALNVVLRHGPSIQRIPVGINSMYPKNATRIDLGGGKDLAFGHYQSVRPCAQGLSIIVDRAATAFVANVPSLKQGGSVIDYILKLMGNNSSVHELKRLCFSSNRRDADALCRICNELGKVHFYATHYGYKKVFKKFRELSDESADQITFRKENRDTGEVESVSVAKYFKQEYGIELKHPDLPCINFGTTTKANYIPLEICGLLENQQARGKLKPDQTQEMIKKTATAPKSRFNEVQKSASAIKDESSKYLKEFDIDINLTPVRAVGKILTPPLLQYGNKDVSPAGGKWDMKEIQLYKGAPLTNWAAFNFTRTNFDGFLRQLVDVGNNMGMRIEKPSQISVCDPEAFESTFGRLRQKPDFILWLQRKDDSLYEKMKRFCDIEKGITSQCILEQTFKRLNMQTYANLILKINTKMGGINQCLNEKPRCLSNVGGVMILGADVTHSAPADISEKMMTAVAGERFEVSIAAVVGSLDSDFFKFHAVTRVQQKEKQEMILEFGTMFEEILNKYFHKNNKKLPQLIIFYRDGVSEGQFDAVLAHEESKIRATCKAVGKKLKIEYNPKVTFVVVQKRHHTRLKPQFDADGQGRMKNVPPGTLVDTDIVHPRDFDYFLASHEGIQGTSRPTHYYVLKDENDLTADEIYQLTYYLCHTYAKATRSISIPTPVQYAHLSAFRARQYIVASNAPYDRHTRRSDETEEQRNRKFQSLIKALNERILVPSSLKDKMYFC